MEQINAKLLRKKLMIPTIFASFEVLMFWATLHKVIALLAFESPRRTAPFMAEKNSG